MHISLVSPSSSNDSSAQLPARCLDSSVPVQNSWIPLMKGRCATARILVFISAAISFGTDQKSVVLVTRSGRGWHGTDCARQYLQTLRNLGIALDGRKRALWNIMAAVPVATEMWHEEGLGSASEANCLWPGIGRDQG